MRKYAIPAKKIGQLVVSYPQPFAYSPHTNERCSASEGDYFMLGFDEVLRDSDGNEMFLMREVCELLHIDADEDV
jgi:hypothetical protein